LSGNGYVQGAQGLWNVVAVRPRRAVFLAEISGKPN
jgi:hypothetical protein